MTLAYQALREALRARPELDDLRTAAFFVAIEKIARSYLELGIFHKAISACLSRNVTESP